MFYFLNKKKILQLVIVVALLIWAVFTIITQMTACPVDGQTFLCQNFFCYLGAHPILMKALAIAFILLEMIFIQKFFESNKFSDNQTNIPLVLFLLFINVSHVLNTFTPAFLTIFLVSFIMLFNTRDENDRSSYHRVYASGILVGLNTLIDPCAIWLLLFLMLVILTNQFSKPKEIIILLLGFLTVAIYLFSIMFLEDSFPTLQHSLKYLYTFVPLKQLSLTPMVKIVAIGVVILASIYMSIADKLYFDSKLVILRKRFTAIHFLFFISIVMMLFSGMPLANSMLYLSLPITIYASVLCLNKNRVVFHDVVLILMFVMLWL